MANGPAILILAAGSSSRMRGADKLMEQVDGQPLIARMAQTALATGQPVHIALPPDRPLRRAALRGLPVTLIEVAAPQTGLSASLCAGVKSLPRDTPVLILLADLPDLTTADLTTLLTAFAANPDALHRATSADGKPGHPVIFPPRFRPELERLEGDTGARDLLMRLAGQTILIPLPGQHATTDLDTPEDWAAWRAART